MIHLGRYAAPALPVVATLAASAALAVSTARADGDNNTLIPNNKQLNDAVAEFMDNVDYS